MTYNADACRDAKRQGFKWNRDSVVMSLACAFIITACEDNSGRASASASSTPVVVPTLMSKVASLYPIPDPSTLAAGYTLDPNGCVVATSHMPPTTRRPV